MNEVSKRSNDLQRRMDAWRAMSITSGTEPKRELPAVGTRVRLRHDIDRYPHFIAPAGSLGTVVCNDNPYVFSVQLDLNLAGAEDWDNCVQWANDDLGIDTGMPEVLEDIEPITPGQSGYDHERRAS